MDHCYFLLTCQVKIVIVIYLLVELNSDSERIWKWMERFVTDFLFFFFFLTSQALIKFLALMTRCQEGCSKSICSAHNLLYFEHSFKNWRLSTESSKRCVLYNYKTNKRNPDKCRVYLNSDAIPIHPNFAK